MLKALNKKAAVVSLVSAIAFGSLAAIAGGLLIGDLSLWQTGILALIVGLIVGAIYPLLDKRL
ncbi:MULTISPECIES: hypothetical protein [unclassified Iodidimonas]|uniref:hypothetical protein n=1 Tax=unclassified Iodidimonas TaxID=2626145 RepID=UPI0024823F90|nr:MULTISPECIES: hypothetical protein [unclassified Iodidimonas]